MNGDLRGRLVTLFGGDGFIGTYVAATLLARGARLRIASRNPSRAHRLRPLANLGQMQAVRCDITREPDIAAALSGAQAVVNLVGAFAGNLDLLMGHAPGTMARLSAAAGVDRFVHVSATAADPQGATAYARAKALGERLVREHQPRAVVVRPTIVFGRDDGFITMFARLIRRFRVLPVFGPDAPLQLVYVDDVAEAIATALEHPERHGGEIFELGGPDTLTMLELNERIARAQRRRRTFVPMPDAASGLFASLPGSPMSRDQWLMLKAGTRVSGSWPGFAELGITPRPLDLFLDEWMVPYRRHGRFATKNPDYKR
ncbi:complex I NDUFA9 subunit family protein [Erythrobacteraceae bacterium CFH 75059]|uniref:complex I NDUFA9 subunit family protein n=1 Tax=Qipengyuania thermophila TaxID=2509361 RepID=UPI001020B147|nr:complex I NDUFA9 subunit family protein [Qipengyuania thermophila]TCD06385.1 complex I NDUFA9 subunit family protein [Erythrobacteraceae bacterium CFH 75059]